MSLFEKIEQKRLAILALQEEAMEIFETSFTSTIDTEYMSKLGEELLNLANRISYKKMSDDEGGYAYYTVLSFPKDVTISILTNTYSEDWTEFHNYDESDLELFSNSCVSDLYETLDGLSLGYDDEDVRVLWDEMDCLFAGAQKKYGQSFLLIREEI